MCLKQANGIPVERDEKMVEEEPENSDPPGDGDELSFPARFASSQQMNTL
jgi:hypothetical protein